MIRKATKQDVTCIAEMAIMMWDSNSIEELAEEFETVLYNEECAIYLYCIDHMPIGFAQCGLRHDYVEGTESSPVGYLEGIFIREGYRKNGYARICCLNVKNGQNKRNVPSLQVIVSWIIV